MVYSDFIHDHHLFNFYMRESIWVVPLVKVEGRKFSAASGSECESHPSRLASVKSTCMPLVYHEMLCIPHVE